MLTTVGLLGENLPLKREPVTAPSLLPEIRGDTHLLKQAIVWPPHRWNAVTTDRLPDHVSRGRRASRADYSLARHPFRRDLQLPWKACRYSSVMPTPFAHGDPPCEPSQWFREDSLLIVITLSLFVTVSRFTRVPKAALGRGRYQCLARRNSATLTAREEAVRKRKKRTGGVDSGPGRASCRFDYDLTGSAPRRDALTRLLSTCAEASVGVIAVDPAYTSMWGAQHWQKPLATKRGPASRHQAAAVAIKRSPHIRTALTRRWGRARQERGGPERPRPFGVFG